VRGEGGPKKTRNAPRYNAGIGQLAARTPLGDPSHRDRTPRGRAPDSRLWRAAAKPVPEEVVGWKNLGEWSGRGNAQTESFVGLTGALRMRWRTNNETPQGTGTFRLILQSAISGRDLQETVDEKVRERARRTRPRIHARSKSRSTRKTSIGRSRSKRRSSAREDDEPQLRHRILERPDVRVWRLVRLEHGRAHGRHVLRLGWIEDSLPRGLGRLGDAAGR
jgi:hypothetical protein